MIPVNQSISSGVWGDCFEACVASILERPLSDIPTILAGNPDDWFDSAARLLGPLGVSLLYISNNPPVRPSGYAIGCGDYHRGEDGTVIGGTGWGDGGDCYFPLSWLCNPRNADDFWTITTVEG